MVSPLKNQSDPLIQALHAVDQRAEKSLVNAFLLKIPDTQASLRKTIRQIRDIHPELTDALFVFFTHFPSVLLQSKEKRFSISSRFVPELSHALSASLQAGWKESEHPVDLSEYDATSVSLLIDIFTGKEVDQHVLIEQSQQLLALTDLWQCEKISLDLAALDEAILKELSADDIVALIECAKKYHNLLVYVALLKYVAKDSALIVKLPTDEQQIVQDPIFSSHVSISGSYVVLKIVEILTSSLYQRLATFARSSSGGKLAVTVCPPLVATSALLLSVQRTFEQFGFPEKLIIRSPACATDGLQAVLRACPASSRLESLELSGLKIGNKVVAFLPHIQTLKELTLTDIELSSYACPELERYLSEQPKLELLSLKKNALSSVGIESLARGLVKLPHIKTLNLSENHLDHHAPELLRNLIGSSKTLEILDLSANLLNDQGAIQLAAVLQHSHAIEELYLANCGISDEGIQAVCQSLQENPLVYQLDLSGNTISPNGLLAICDLLKLGITLYSLNLAKTNLTDSDGCRLAKSLASNKALKCLNLSNTQVGDLTAMALATALGVNPSLHTILLMNTQTTDTGAEPLIETIRQMARFELLQLSSTEISEDLATKVATDPRILI